MTYFRPLTIVGCLLLLLCCEPQEVDTNPAPPLLGFGDVTGTVSLAGEVAEARILWTRSTTEEQQLFLNLEGPAGETGDVELLTPNPLLIEPGSNEAVIQFRAASLPDDDRINRRGRLQLLPSEWFRLSDRDTFGFNFSLNHTVQVTLWAPETAFPQLWGYTSFGPEPVPPGDGLDAGRHFAFAHASTSEPNVIGMFNEQAGRSTNALNLHRIYSDYEVSSSSADIRIPRLFRLIPATEGATSGRVEVIEQRVTITRRSTSGLPPFTVGISGDGTYDESTGVIAVAITFDESELGVAEPVLRRYQYETRER